MMTEISNFIVNHWALSLALLLILVMIFLNEIYSQKQQGKALSAQALVDKMNSEDAQVFDLRDTQQFQKGHITGAQRVNADDFSQPRLTKYKNKPVILVCAKGLQSAPLAASLKTQGYTDVMILSGGMMSWTDAGLPLVKGK